MEDTATFAPTVQDGWLLWEASGKAVSVRLSPDLINRLGLAVREGFKSLRRRGLETGGFLIGTTREEGARIAVEVVDFEPVESEHANGPSYLLSDADRRLLEIGIAAHNRSGGKSSIVGFYRSHTRPDFCITDEDAALFSRYFPKASDVFLLIKSNEGGAPTGGFIIREAGAVLSRRPYTEFPLNLTIAKPRAREIPGSAVQRSTRPLQAPTRVVQFVPTQAPKRAAWTAKWSIGLATAAVIALAVGLSFGSRKSGTISAEPVHPLALNVTNSGKSLKLSWDHQVSGRASRAVLWIRDGKDEQRFELDSKQLSEGSIAYWPRNSDVNFRLELVADGAGVTESVRAIGGPSQAPVAELPVAELPVARPPVAEPPVARPPRNLSGTASRQFSRAFVLPKRAPAAAPPPSLPDPPAVHSLPAPPIESTVPVHSYNSRDRAVSAVQVSVEPVQGSRLERFARNIPLLGKHYRRTDYVPPAPLRHLPLPSLQHRAVTHDVEIDIKVLVNPAGKVEYSEVLSKVLPADGDLKAMALISARECQFVPAHAAGGAVAGVVILHYRFVPEAPVSANPAVAAR
jgi:hypothetical protein